MSRVYTAKSVVQAVDGTAGYVQQFLRSLPSTRIAFGLVPAPGTTLVELFLNLFDTSDPYTAEEVELLKSWLVLPPGKTLDSLESNYKLHAFPSTFAGSFLPPRAWAEFRLRSDPEAFAPLPQSSARVYRKGNFQHRIGKG